MRGYRFMPTLAVALLAPKIALAAPQVTSTAPSADSVAQGVPPVVELSFSEPLRTGRIAVRGPDGKRADGNDSHPVQDKQHWAVGLHAQLPGRYRVDWRATPGDGKATSGSFGFTVSP